MTRLRKGIRLVVPVLAALHILLWMAFYLGSRRASVVVRELNKRTLNPLMLRFAGGRGFYAGALRHVGRSSGITYTTPVVARPAPGGFIVPLPYGTDVDWLKNVQAAGSARLAVDGSTHVVGRPRIIPAEKAAPFISDRMRRALDWQGVSAYLRLDSVPLGQDVESRSRQAPRA